MSIAARTRVGERSGHSWTSRVGSWELWSVPRRAIALVLTVEALVGAAAVVALTHIRPAGTDLIRAILLLMLCVGYAEAAGRIERVRLYLGGGVATSARANPTSIWTFAAALILPAGYAVLVVALIYGHIVLTGYRQRTLRPYRIGYDCAAVISGVLAAEAVRHALGIGVLHGDARSAAVGILALVAYSAVSLIVVLVGAYFYTGAPNLRAVLPGGSDAAFEIATLVLGLAAADLIVHLPWAAPLLLVPVAVLHRSTMIAELSVAARTDGKTGLLTATAWQQTARQQLSQAGRNGHAATVLVLDLDHFKTINDRYGHLVGDIALRNVARCLHDELRDYDAVGRFGGEEFVALLPEVDLHAAQRIAQRVQRSLRGMRPDDHPDLQITASIGIAGYPVHGTSLEALLAAADAALFHAKAAGRDRVELSSGVP